MIRGWRFSARLIGRHSSDAGMGAMVMQGRTRALALVGTALCLSLEACRVVFGGSTPSGGPACLPSYTATAASAKGQTQGPVEISARLNWHNEVSTASGAGYSQWNNAHARNIACSHDDRLIRTWTCAATAEPCRG